MHSKESRRAYNVLIEEIVSRVRQKDFPRQTELSLAYGKSPSFASKIRMAAVSRGLITNEEWMAGFTKARTRTVHWTCPACRHRWQSKSRA